jgi:hypothetical protein
MFDSQASPLLFHTKTRLKKKLTSNGIVGRNTRQSIAEQIADSGNGRDHIIHRRGTRSVGSSIAF